MWSSREQFVTMTFNSGCILVRVTKVAHGLEWVVTSSPFPTCCSALNEAVAAAAVAAFPAPDAAPAVVVVVVVIPAGKSAPKPTVTPARCTRCPRLEGPNPARSGEAG